MTPPSVTYVCGINCKIDDELYMRWVEFGVFSPINRLHSTSHDLQGKEPWNYRFDVENCTKEYLRLRHRLIPYLYSMDYRTHKDGIALCEPLYYTYPYDENAYKIRNEYFFGSELIVCPITSKLNKKIILAKERVYLPKGRWTDIFTGWIYNGDKFIEMHRDLSKIPVLAKEGAIIPFGNNTANDISLPLSMDIWVYRGRNSFNLYEGEKDIVNTTFKIVENKEIIFNIEKSEGNTSILPQSRKFNIFFKDVNSAKNIDVKINGRDAKAEINEKELINTIEIKPIDSATITLRNYVVKTNGDLKYKIINILSKYQGNNLIKMSKYRKLKNVKLTDSDFIKTVQTLHFPKSVREAIKELIASVQ
jgi:alpha-glucosidase (family GH31 glycosyl hydrolase)